MKKSLQIALQEARELSKEHPNIAYYVMDKKGKTASVHTCEWAQRELVFEGWQTVCRFENGQKM